MESSHKCKLSDLCRVCGYRLHKKVMAKRKAAKLEPTYPCCLYADSLLAAFGISVASDANETHPQQFCTLCYKAMARIFKAKNHQNQFKCHVQPYNWHIHSANTCKVCVNIFGHVHCIHHINISRCASHLVHIDGRLCHKRLK